VLLPALAAIDKSGNVSPELSTEVPTRRRARAISTFANNDTTINPDVPPRTVQANAETPRTTR
jgi:hypothetical protein